MKGGLIEMVFKAKKKKKQEEEKTEEEEQEEEQEDETEEKAGIKSLTLEEIFDSVEGHLNRATQLLRYVRSV